MESTPRSRDALRAVDAWAAEVIGLPTLVLMENAGRGAADLLLGRLRPGDRVLILCGPGNNGGDGAVVARHLDLHDIPVRLLWLADLAKLSPDASVQFQVLQKLGFDQRSVAGAMDSADLDALLAEATWIVDGLLGTGLTRPVSGPIAAAISAVNRSGTPVLALDLPSGLDADTGEPLGDAIRATLTATFAAPKLGFARSGASDYTGEVHVLTIGVRPQSA